MRSSVISALEKIKIGKQEIASIVEPYFQQVLQVAKTAMTAATAARAKTPEIENFYKQIGPYLNSRPSISIIERTLTKIEGANEKEKIISRPLETYLNIMNGFFGDSKKAIVFHENSVRVRLPSESTTDSTAPKFRERQIFVLITDLLFNPSMRDENIFLIDEPELSLHLKWQRQFVHAIRTANQAIQMVLATHSPEIIFDMDTKLIQLEI